MNADPARFPARNGFTLIEVTLATVLFSLLMASYYVVFLNVLQLEETAREDRSFASVGPAILDLIEDDLLSIYTHPAKPEAFPFRGQDESMGSEPADRLAFVVRRESIHQEEFHGSGNWVRSPINEVGYRMGRGDSGEEVRKLYRRESYYVDQSPLDGGDYYEIYDRVVAFDVLYAGYRVEEEERSSSDTLGRHELDKFESWDSEERKAFPTAVIVTLTIEAPPMGAGAPREEAPRRQTLVRIIPLPHSDDVAAPEATTGATTPGGTPPAQPGTGPTAPAR